ncbi:MAG: serine hydrolase, partial [Pseudomonadota bacterium]|nr:serine hydrolase [Pseudomonadota bacterium]
MYAKHKKQHSVAQPNAYVVIDAKTGKIIAGSNQRAARYPASLTKMMTLYLLFEAMDEGKVSLDDRLKVSL